MQSRTSELERIASSTNHKLDTVFRLSRKFVRANDENEVISMVIREFVDLVGAIGASLVPLDERGQPLTAISHGELPQQVMDAWIEYLASPEMRHRCDICKQLGAFSSNWPLI